MDRNRLHIATIILRWVTASLLALPQGIFALPTGGAVVEGEATIGVNPSNPQHQIINQTSSKAIIDWQSFSIGSQEITQFIQPDAAAIALNRVIGGDPSVILGTLKANGQVWLINPAGILFGRGATVDVAGLLATTSDISNQNFISGHYHFLQPLDKGTSVINQGHIKVKDSGIAALVAPAVHNSGVIEANLGSVVLASGTEFTVDLYGDNLIHFALNQPKLLAASSGSGSNLFDTDGNPLKDAVTNSGQIIANGGKILLTTAAAKQVVESLINMNGVVQANSVIKQGGKVILQGNSAVKEGDKFIWQGKGENEGLVKVTGKIEARGEKGEKGGQVTITGKRVGLFFEELGKQGAIIDVSGTEGGGKVLVGGDFQGKGSLPWAEAVVMQKGSQIAADALNKGDGGTAVLWSESCTRFYGDISARGGKSGGNGGRIETSGHWLDTGGKIDASAPKGLAGEWLLDPWNVEITGAASGGGGFNPVSGVEVWTPSAMGSHILNTAISDFLDAGTSVRIQTSGGGGAEPGDITVQNFIVKNIGDPCTLTLQANNNITINDWISDNGVDHPLTLILIAPGVVTTTQTDFSIISVVGLQLNVGTSFVGGTDGGGGHAPSFVDGSTTGDNIVLLNTFGPGTHFFNTFDLYDYLPPSPPSPPSVVTPTPPTNVIVSVLDPTNFSSSTPPPGTEDRPSLIETQSPPPSSPPASSPPPAAPPPAETPPAEAPPAEPPAAAPPNEAPAPVAPPPTPERTEPPGYDVPGGTEVIGGGSEGREPIETPEGAGGQEGIAEGAFNPEVERTEEVDMPCPVNFEETNKPIPPNCPEKPRGPVSAESLADAEVSPDSEIGKELNRAPIGPEGITGIDMPVGAAGIGGDDLGQEKIETAEAAGGDESLLARNKSQYGFSLEDIDRSPEYLENLGPKRPEPLSLWGRQMFARLKKDGDEEWS